MPTNAPAKTPPRFAGFKNLDIAFALSALADSEVRNQLSHDQFISCVEEARRSIDRDLAEVLFDHLQTRVRITKYGQLSNEQVLELRRQFRRLSPSLRNE